MRRNVVPWVAGSITSALLLLASNSAQYQQVIDITLEQRQGSDWKPVSSQKVFHSADDIRFRLHSQMAGYLYVMNKDSGGRRNWLYPRTAQTGTNHIEVDKTYIIPDAKGSFLVGGQPGFDVTYWMIAPSALDLSTGDGTVTAMPNTLLPRCQPRLLKARGVCEDQQAGPHPVLDPDEIQRLFSNYKGLVSRDLKFQAGQPDIRISAPGAPSGSITYALWIAHQ
jgi:hypothetical protein